MDAKAKFPALQSLDACSDIPDLTISVFANAITAVAVFADNGRTLYINAEMQCLAESLGYPVATLLDLAPDDHTSAAHIDFERYRAGSIDKARLRYQILRKDGTPFWADMVISRRALIPDRAPATVIQIVDVTAEHEAHEATARNQTRWEVALGAAGQGVWEFDIATQTLSVSYGWRRLRGLSDTDVVPTTREGWLANVHPDDCDRIDRISAQQGMTDGLDTIEYRERRRDGRYIWIYSGGKPYAFDAEGRPLKVIGTDTDITRLKAVEAELEQEKERLQVTLQSIADGVISTDAAGKVTFINKAAEEITGWTVDAAMGQPIETVFDSRVEGNTEARNLSVAQCLRSGRVVHTTNYTLLKSTTGRSRYVREFASPVRTDAGEIIGAVMVVQDATQRRKLQRDLERSATHDSLTGLCNRGAFETCLKARVRDAGAGVHRHALCLIDLDHFKLVNDSAGHAAGDVLLQEVARIIQNTSRESDCVARLGGDEFAVILAQCDLKLARRIAQKILKHISTLRFPWQDETFQLGASIGIAAIDGATTSADQIYRNADTACYSAKRHGRGCAVVFG